MSSCRAQTDEGFRNGERCFAGAYSAGGFLAVVPPAREVEREGDGNSEIWSSSSSDVWGELCALGEKTSSKMASSGPLELRPEASCSSSASNPCAVVSGGAS